MKTDNIKTYVDWAIKQGFAVIDVNLPKHVSGFDVDGEHEDNDSIENRTREATSLLTYIWDNYIMLGESTHIFLMGTNTGHGAILNFIRANEERAQMLNTAISFVEDVPLLSAKSQTNDAFARWYHGASQVFVSGEHGFWATDFARKPKKRFGRVIQSSRSSLPEMLQAHSSTVFECLSERTEGWTNSGNVTDDDVGTSIEAGSLLISPRRNPAEGNATFSTGGS